MSALDDGLAHLREAAAAADRTYRLATAPPMFVRTLADRARAYWRGGDLSTWDIAQKLGIHEAEVCQAIVRSGETREAARTDGVG